MFEILNHVAFTVSHVTYTTTSGSTTASYSVGWFSLALINAGIAQGKNRGGLNWFLLSLFLGPLATFALVALYPKEPGMQ